MSSEVDFPANEATWNYAVWALDTGLWDGRPITWKEAPEFLTEVRARLQRLLFSQEPDSMDFKKIAAPLAWIGSSGSARMELLREIEEFRISPNGAVVTAKHKHKHKHKHHKKKEEETFWEKHKVEIIIGIVIVAVVTTVVVATVCTGGTGGEIAAAVGGAAISELQNALEKPSKKEISHFPEFQPEPFSIPQPEPIEIGPISVIPEKGDLLKPPEIPLPTFLQEITLSNQSQSPVFSEPEQELPQNPLPWESESISYLQWRQQQLQEELLFSKPTPTFPNLTPLDEAPFPKPIPSYTPPEPKIDNKIIDNFASKACKGCYTNDFRSPPPFQEIQLLGRPDQSTIHFHCGINNDASTVLEGGTCLNHQLKEEFAVQPHLVHSNGLVRGLTAVGLEKLHDHKENVIPQLLFGFSSQLAGPILQHSDIQRSIAYEVEHLSKTAQSILEKDNPKLKQVHVTFSNGGYVLNEALKQLPPQYRETIVVITAGTTKIIENGLACEVVNLIGDKDWPSKVCNGGERGIERAKSEANINIIPQTETDGILGGHYFTQPDYQEEISSVLKKKIAKKYEIY